MPITKVDAEREQRPLFGDDLIQTGKAALDNACADDIVTEPKAHAISHGGDAEHAKAALQESVTQFAGPLQVFGQDQDRARWEKPH